MCWLGRVSDISMPASESRALGHRAQFALMRAWLIVSSHKLTYQHIHSPCLDGREGNGHWFASLWRREWSENSLRNSVKQRLEFGGSWKGGAMIL